MTPNAERAAVAREVLAELLEFANARAETVSDTKQFMRERYPAPPAPETVTVGKSEWRLSPNGYWTGSAGEIVSHATWAHDFLHRIASDARELAERDRRIAELEQDRDSWRRTCETVTGERDAARREVEALQERLAAVAPSPALSAEEKQGSHPAPVAPAPIPLGATVEIPIPNGVELWEFTGHPGDLWAFRRGDNGVAVVLAALSTSCTRTFVPSGRPGCPNATVWSDSAQRCIAREGR